MKSEWVAPVFPKRHQHVVTVAKEQWRAFDTFDQAVSYLGSRRDERLGHERCVTFHFPDGGCTISADAIAKLLALLARLRL